MSNDNTPPIIRPQNVSITDKRELYRCYMPFIAGGALFIPFNDDISPHKVTPGMRIPIILTLMEGKKTPIQGRVVWISKSGMNKGYGVAFGDSAPMKDLKERIESTIVDFLAKKDPNYTI